MHQVFFFPPEIWNINHGFTVFSFFTSNPVQLQKHLICKAADMANRILNWLAEIFYLCTGSLKGYFRKYYPFGKLA